MASIKRADNLTNDEWRTMEDALANSRFSRVIRKLRELKNFPQLTHDIFEDDDTNQGEEALNVMFRLKNIPFHLRRFGDFGESRGQRRLAIARWSYEHQLRLPGIYSPRHRQKPT